MTENAVSAGPAPTPITLLGTGTMGTALARAWLAAGHPVTVWNRTPARAEALAAEGATVAGSAAAAVAANRLVIVCLLDDASVGEALKDADLTGRDIVNLTTGTPDEGRSRAAWAEERGARFADGGIMAVPPMIGEPESGAFVFYSGSAELVEEHRAALAVPAAARYVGADAGHAALHDIALLSGMYGMLAGITHAFAMIDGQDIAPKEFAPLLVEWLTAMTALVHGSAERLESGDFTTDVVSSLGMQVAGSATFFKASEETGVSPELLTPYWDLMRRRVEAGHGDEDNAGVIPLLKVHGG